MIENNSIYSRSERQKLKVDELEHILEKNRLKKTNLEYTSTATGAREWPGLTADYV